VGFGFQIPGHEFPGAEPAETFDRILELATAAERSGWASVWVMDHFWQLPPLGGPTHPILEGWTLLGALAARTERVQLGTLVTGVTYRNPALVAKMATTLDVISKGRAVVGLGFDYPRDGVRLDMLEEALQICRLMFTEETPSFSGRHYRIQDAYNLPRPLRGDIPILVGGGGEKRTLRLVAQYADACNVHGDPAMIRHKMAVIDRHCADVGRDPAEVRRTWAGTLFLLDTAEEAAAYEAMLRPAAGDEYEHNFIVGDEPTVIDRVAALVEAGIDDLIVNMPTMPPATVERAGRVLTDRFGG
jgi:F420-dependent oxidoreductase-like protein